MSEAIGTPMDDAAPPVVLVVEDEAVIRMLLVDCLEDAGFIVVEADSADVAIAILGGRRAFYAVITDLRMPGTMDGLGLASWMREHAPAIPIMITSGFAARPDVATINPSIQRVLAKPYKANDIVAWVDALKVLRPE